MWETSLTQLPYYCSRSHQMRLIKWDLKYRRLDGETAAFLKEAALHTQGGSTRRAGVGMRASGSPRPTAWTRSLRP